MKTNFRMIVLFMTMVSESVVHSQNVLPNGDFSDTLKISGWTAVGTSSISFNHDDVNNQPGSGDMLIYAEATNPTLRAESACFPVTGGSSFQFGGKYSLFEIFGVGLVRRWNANPIATRTVRQAKPNWA